LSGNAVATRVGVMVATRFESEWLRLITAADWYIYPG
jgi:hypothetical protein